MSQTINLPPRTEIVKTLPINSKINPVQYGTNIQLTNISEHAHFEVFISFDDDVPPRLSHQYHYYHNTLTDTTAPNYTLRNFLPHLKVIECFSFGKVLDLAFLQDDGIFNRFNHTSIVIQVITGDHDVSFTLSMPAPLSQQQHDELKAQFVSKTKNVTTTPTAATTVPDANGSGFNVNIDLATYGDSDADEYFTGTTAAAPATGGYDPDFDDDFLTDDDESGATTIPAASTAASNTIQCTNCKEMIPKLQHHQHTIHCSKRYTWCDPCGSKYQNSLQHTHCAQCEESTPGAHVISTELFLPHHIKAYHSKFICECLHYHRQLHLKQHPEVDEDTGNLLVPFNPKPYIFEYSTIKEHKLKQCVLRDSTCYYCSAIIPFHQQQEHEKKCKFQTAQCEYCHKTVQHHQKIIHYVQAHQFDMSNLPNVKEWQATHLFDDTSAEVQHLENGNQGDVERSNQFNELLEERVLQHCLAMGIDPTSSSHADLVDGVRAEVLTQLQQELGW